MLDASTVLDLPEHDAINRSNAARLLGRDRHG